MKEIILCKYGEIALKGLNKSSFESMMTKSVKRRLKSCGQFSVSKAQSTLYVEPLNDDSRTVSKRMEIKQLIAKLKLVNPQVEYNIFKSVENVMLNQVIAYKDDEGRHSFLERFKEE